MTPPRTETAPSTTSKRSFIVRMVALRISVDMKTAGSGLGSRGSNLDLSPLCGTRRGFVPVVGPHNGLQARGARQKGTGVTSQGSVGISRAEPGRALDWLLQRAFPTQAGGGDRWLGTLPALDRNELREAADRDFLQRDGADVETDPRMHAAEGLTVDPFAGERADQGLHLR